MSDTDVKMGNGHDGSGDPAQATGPASADAPPDADATAARIEKAERERDDSRDKMLRALADFENYKRRVKRETDDAAFRIKEQMLREILPVLDNFERALVAVGKGGTLESLAQGVKLVEKQLHAAMEKFGVKAFEAKGEPFDPARHEAIQQVETDEASPGTVHDVFARGYTLGERLLRPAMVSVAKAKAGPAADAGAPRTDGDGRDEPQ